MTELFYQIHEEQFETSRLDIFQKSEFVNSLATV